MTLKQHLVQGSRWVSLVAALSLSALGCDDSNANPSPDDTAIITPKAGKGGGSTAAGKGGSGGKEGSAGKGGSGDAGAGKGSAGKGGAGGAGGKAGSSASVGEPVDINAKNGATCDPFDNSKLTKWHGEGTAPEIP